MIRFDFAGLTPGMQFLLSWLIDRGGADTQSRTLLGARVAAKPFGLSVTASTLRALLRRSYLERSNDMTRVQVSPWAITMACRYASNPHPEPVMQVRAEYLAHLENAARTADMIKAAWGTRNDWEVRA